MNIGSGFWWKIVFDKWHFEKFWMRFRHILFTFPRIKIIRSLNISRKTQIDSRAV